MIVHRFNTKQETEEFLDLCKCNGNVLYEHPFWYVSLRKIDMSTKSFKAELQDVFDAWKAAKADGEICIHDIANIVSELGEALQRLADQVVGDDAEYDKLIADAELFTSEQLVPLNPTFLGFLPLLVRPFMTKFRPKPH